MSKIKIESNSSGTGVITLVSPNTDTDRTITLPDESITLGGGVDGIVSSADATAITIDSSERVGFGTTTPQAIIVSKESTVSEAINFVAESHGSAGETGGYYFAAHGVATPRRKQAIVNKKNTGGSTGDYGVGSLHFLVDTNTDDADVAIGDSKLEITSDGRGLSQFTAKAWARLDGSQMVFGTGTDGIYDSHNIASVVDYGTGHHGVNLANAMGNTNYAVMGNGCTTTQAGLRTVNVYSYATSLFKFGTTYVDGTVADIPHINLVVFGD